MLKLGIDPEKLYRATFIRQYDLCCCNMALVSFRLFCKNLRHLREFFGQMVYRLPLAKNFPYAYDATIGDKIVACITGALRAKRHERGVLLRARDKRESREFFSPRLALRAKCRVRLAWLIKRLLCRLTKLLRHCPQGEQNNPQSLHPPFKSWSVVIS